MNEQPQTPPLAHDFTEADLELAYPRWSVWQAEESGQWWATVRFNLTRRQRDAGCEPHVSAPTPGELAELIAAEDAKADSGDR